MSESGEDLRGKIDTLYLTPRERAAHIYEKIERAGVMEGEVAWNITCFAYEYLVMQAIIMGSETIIEALKPMGEVLYTLHYHFIEDILGEPDRHAFESAKEDQRTDVHPRGEDQGVHPGSDSGS